MAKIELWAQSIRKVLGIDSSDQSMLITILEITSTVIEMQVPATLQMVVNSQAFTITSLSMNRDD